LYKSPNDAMTNIDGWRAASTLEQIQMGASATSLGLLAWPDYFGELRPTANSNTWTLGWMEPTPVVIGAPTANFTAAPNPANISQTITFTDTSTGAPTSWQWNFGDGTTSTLQNPTKSYSAAGTYTVSLTATNAGGSNAKSLQVVVSPPLNTSPYEAENATLGGGVEPPQVLTTNTGYSGNGYVGFFGRTGNYVQFSISGLAAGPYSLQLRWGRADAGSASRVIRVNGTVVATPTIGQTANDWSDPARFVLSTSIPVTLTSSVNAIRVEYTGPDLQYIDLDRISLTPITGPTNPPVANFNFAPNNPTPGALMSFTDASTNSPSAWAWDFGDGSTSNAQNPTKAYASPGTYSVSLTATNSVGSNTKSVTVTVVGVTSGQPTAGDSITVTGNPLQNLVAYTAHVEVRDTNGLIGTDTEDFSTSWIAPTAPSFTVVP
jgi:PKD repeat protein